MEYRTIESYAPERPPEIDTTSSKTEVYIRRNIKAVPNEEAPGTHWEMEEATLTLEEAEEYFAQLESPALDMIMQHMNDVTANQELGEITTEENHEEQMQLLNDIQADIALIGTEE
jgi:hypothetical protein